MSGKTVYTRDDDLNVVSVRFVGDPNGVKVNHTPDGVVVMGQFQLGVLEVHVDTETLPEGVVRPGEVAEYVGPSGEVANADTAQAEAADPDVEAARREIRDAQAEGQTRMPAEGDVRTPEPGAVAPSPHEAVTKGNE